MVANRTVCDGGAFSDKQFGFGSGFYPGPRIQSIGFDDRLLSLGPYRHTRRIRQDSY